MSLEEIVINLEKVQKEMKIICSRYQIESKIKSYIGTPFMDCIKCPFEDIISYSEHTGFDGWENHYSTSSYCVLNLIDLIVDRVKHVSDISKQSGKDEK